MTLGEFRQQTTDLPDNTELWCGGDERGIGDVKAIQVDQSEPIVIVYNCAPEDV